jgi:hypothetical protein
MKKIVHIIHWTFDRVWLYVPMLMIITMVSCLLKEGGIYIMVPFTLFIIMAELWSAHEDESQYVEKEALMRQTHDERRRNNVIKFFKRGA